MQRVVNLLPLKYAEMINKKIKYQINKGTEIKPYIIFNICLLFFIIKLCLGKELID